MIFQTGDDEEKDACRVFGSMDIHRVQGDLHFTAAGHGYADLRHLEHDRMNFSHVVEELSFGEFYPNLINPLDGVVATTEAHLYQYQYFVNIVPTVYRTDYRSIHTNQYAVTSQSHPTIAHAMGNVPGIFFKYDVEPFMLDIHHASSGVVKFITRVIGLLGGLIVSLDWISRLLDLVVRKLRPQSKSTFGEKGLLNGNMP
jgi:hypothetical protein